MRRNRYEIDIKIDRFFATAKVRNSLLLLFL